MATKPIFVLTSRKLLRTRNTVEFYSGDLAHFVNGRLRPAFRSIWFVGGGVVSGECLRLGLADEVRYSILPILIGEGIPFFEKLALPMDLTNGWRWFWVMVVIIGGSLPSLTFAFGVERVSV
jgi:dihydrofolate reductase